MMFGPFISLLMFYFSKTNYSFLSFHFLFYLLPNCAWLNLYMGFFQKLFQGPLELILYFALLLQESLRNASHVFLWLKVRSNIKKKVLFFSTSYAVHIILI